MNRYLAALMLLRYAMAAQQSPVPLKPANGRLDLGFSIARLSMQELHDGRVIVSDARDNHLVVGDFTTGKTQPIPNVAAMPLLALPGDTSVLMGLDSRWVFLDGAKPIGMLTRDNPVVAAAPYADGADTAGNVLTTRDEKPPHGDSAVAVLVNRATADATIVTHTWEPQRGVRGTPLPPFLSYEQPLMATDGWIAVVRVAPYRVDWRTPGGRWILGAPIPVRAVPVDDREKQFVMLRRAHGGTPESPSTITSWPDVVPPTTAGYPPVLTLDGGIVVLRTPTAAAPAPRYDVINRRGELDRQVVLASGEYIIGFGVGSVYVGVMGKDDVQHVERHPWP